ncbi:hypothetical protein B0H14DRAFT_2579837 [Mycena olivaceomarginata]|nr:hypothetical protein B0H14DRAFT_2579837 [Mycena olivaceomarginata]
MYALTMKKKWPIPQGGSTVPQSLVSDDFRTFSWMDLYIMQKFSLEPTWIKTGIVSAPGSVLYLHDIENALSAFLAASFWIAGHVQQRPLVLKYRFDDLGKPEESDPPVLGVSSDLVTSKYYGVHSFPQIHSQKRHTEDSADGNGYTACHLDTPKLPSAGGDCEHTAMAATLSHRVPSPTVNFTGSTQVEEGFRTMASLRLGQHPSGSFLRVTAELSLGSGNLKAKMQPKRHGTQRNSIRGAGQVGKVDEQGLNRSGTKRKSFTEAEVVEGQLCHGKESREEDVLEREEIDRTS